MTESKKLVHELYNSIADSGGEDLDEIKEVLLDVYQKLDRVNNDVPLINRLVNHIYFKSFTEHLEFSEQQGELISKLSKIGEKAGLLGAYRADYNDKSQFK